MPGTIPVPLRISKGLLWAGKRLNNDYCTCSSSDQYSRTEDSHYYQRFEPPHTKDVFTVYVVNALGLGGSTGFG